MIFLWIARLCSWSFEPKKLMDAVCSFILIRQTFFLKKIPRIFLHVCTLTDINFENILDSTEVGIKRCAGFPFSIK